MSKYFWFVFHCDSPFLSFCFITEHFRRQWGNCWKPKSCHSAGLHRPWLGTQILSVRLGGLDQIIKRNIIFFPPTNKQWTSQFVIYGFHSSKYSLEVFPRGPPKFYHEDSFPHKIPELRYSFLVAQYSAPRAGNRGFKSSVAHWGFREIKLSSFLTRLSRQKSLHKMHTNKEGFHRLIHHCTQGLDTSGNLFPMDNPICSELKEDLSHWVSPFYIHHNPLVPVMPMKPPTNAQPGIKAVALLYVSLNPI